jgi:hypothetical protein
MRDRNRVVVIFATLYRIVASQLAVATAAYNEVAQRDGYKESMLIFYSDNTDQH